MHSENKQRQMCGQIKIQSKTNFWCLCVNWWNKPPPLGFLSRTRHSFLLCGFFFHKFTLFLSSNTNPTIAFLDFHPKVLFFSYGTGRDKVERIWVVLRGSFLKFPSPEMIFSTLKFLKKNTFYDKCQFFCSKFRFRYNFWANEDWVFMPFTIFCR